MIKQQLKDHMKTYMKAKAEEKKTGIRMAMAAIQNKEIELRRELTDEEVIAVLKKQIKEHNESLSYLKETDVAARSEYNAYITALSVFVPEDMSKEEAEKIITKALADANITEKKQKGLAMKTVMPILKGKLDGKIIQEIVDSILM